MTQAHIMADTESLGEAGVRWLEALADEGASVRVPTITDPRGTDFAKASVLEPQPSACSGSSGARSRLSRSSAC